MRCRLRTPPAMSRCSGRTHERGVPVDTITMSTFSGGHRRAITGMTPETIVNYNLTSNPDQQGWYMLQRSQQSGLLTGAVTPQTTTLAGNVLSLHFRYFDGQRWGESGFLESAARDALPVAVAIQIKMAAPGGQVMDFATQVTVPMAIQQW